MASCVGCKFLYGQDIGWSNWTVTDTEVRCMLANNPMLPETMPVDWINSSPEEDNWPVTMNSRCHKYDEGEFFVLDVEGETTIEVSSNDPEVIAAFRNGQFT